MAAKRKWTPEQLKNMKEYFYSDLTNKAIGEIFGCDYNRSIKSFWLEWFGNKEVHNRFKRMCSLSKQGKDNPMYKKTKAAHPRYKVSYVNWQGYRYIDAPDWYTGNCKGTKVMEHIVVGCIKYGLTELPQGHVFHHKDENKLNNNPDNLELLTISAHMIVHAEIRKLLKA